MITFDDTQGSDGICDFYLQGNLTFVSIRHSDSSPLFRCTGCPNLGFKVLITIIVKAYL